MRVRAIARDFGYAAVAQGVSLLLSVVLTLVVPRVLGVAGYGYWQLFVFYGSYAGVFFFGLPDGIYLEHGGESRGKIDKVAIRSQFRVGMALQLVFAFALVFVSLFSSGNEDRTFIIIAVAIFLIISNAEVFLGIVFQTINETRLYSMSILCEKVVYVLLLIIPLLCRLDDFRFYIVLYILAKAAALAYCVWQGREFIFGVHAACGEAIREMLCSMRVGIVLTLANLGSMVILGCARVMVDAAWGIEAFGQTSLAISMVNFFLVFISQLSMVLFPAMRQSSSWERREVLVMMDKVLGVILPFAYLAWPPLVWIVNSWLPQYAQAASMLGILIPMAVFETKMNLCYATYFKVEHKERLLLLANLISVAVVLLLSMACVFLGAGMVAVVLSAVAAMCFRGFVSSFIVGFETHCPFARSYSLDVFASLAFLLLVRMHSNSSWLLISLLVLIVLLIRHRDVYSLVNSLMNMRRLRL